MAESPENDSTTESSGPESGARLEGDRDRSGAADHDDGQPDETDTATEYVLVTEYFHPDTASTGQLMTDLATGLQDRGLDVTVYTGQPNYHSGENERQPKTSVHEGVLVRRIGAPQVRQSSLVRRLCNWTVFTVWMALALLVSRAPDDREVIFVSNPPFLPAVLAPVCRLRGWPYTYVVYDVYPDQPVELGYLDPEGVPARVWARLNGSALRHATNVVALGPAMRDRLCDLAGDGLAREDVAIIDNWADPEFIEPLDQADNEFAREHGLVEPLSLVYSGNVGEFHDLETLVRAAARVADGDGASAIGEEGGTRDLRVLIIGEGDGKRAVVELAERLGVRGDVVEFLPYQPRERLPESLTAGDVSVVAVEEGFEGVCVSSKLYTALAAGTPVLAVVSPDGDEARIVREHDAGVVVPQGDVEGAVAAIRRWASDPDLVARQGANARRTFEARFTRERSLDRYYRLLTTGSVPGRTESG